jgi:hypothetical protein
MSRVRIIPGIRIPWRISIRRSILDFNVSEEGQGFLIKVLTE